MNCRCSTFLLTLLLAGSTPPLSAAEPQVTFTASADTVDCYDFLELVIRPSGSQAKNPFTDVTVEGTFNLEGRPPLRVDGFCDATDGSLFRIRFGASAWADFAMY